jgi:hypothetical protein
VAKPERGDGEFDRQDRVVRVAGLVELAVAVEEPNDVLLAPDDAGQVVVDDEPLVVPTGQPLGVGKALVFVD